MSSSTDTNNKLDKILEKIESLDKKLDSVESKMDKRLCVVEQQCAIITKKSVKHEKHINYIAKEVSDLKAKINAMEQEKLKCNIILKGMNEIESNAKGLNLMVDTILQTFNGFESHHLKHARRIGNVIHGKPRLILAELANTEVKLEIMHSLKNKKFTCDQFSNDGKVWGTNVEQIFISDHLTPVTSKIFYQARQLKKKQKIKYAWSKLGKIYVRKDENSRAHLIESLKQLEDFDKKLDVTIIETDIDTDFEQVMDTDTEVGGYESSSQSKRKLDRSNSDPPKKSPRPKRVKNTSNLNK